MLIVSAYRGYPEGILSALDGGADVNTQDKDGWTALMYAVRYGRQDIANALLQTGADVNVRNKDGKTALDLAEKNVLGIDGEIVLSKPDKNYKSVFALIKSHIEKRTERQEHIFDLNI